MRFLCGLLLLLVVGSASAQTFKPVNPDASPEARKLLAYLYSLQGKYTLSGQHSYNHELNKYMEAAHTLTGKYPAVWGTDFILSGTRDYGPEIVAEAIKKHQDGFIVTLMWHAGRPIDDPPFGWKESIQGKLTDAEFAQVVTPGSELNKRWLVQVDRVAAHLKLLRDAHVPVLWRPFHEMNGVWFWWGDRRGKDGYQKLWKLLFDRFVNYHKLNNLIWVWDANAPRDLPKDQAFPYQLFYPGAAFADVLATDVYHFDYEQNEYQQLVDLAKGKLVALGECGELPKPEILQAQPKWSWFMVWSSWLLSDNTPERVKDVYGMPQVLSHDKVAVKY